MNKSLKEQHQRPEGRLIEAAMKKAPKTSGRQLGLDIGLSEGRIRQIVNGYKTEAGMVLEIVAPADTLARIAEHLKISADDMRNAGRPDVATLLDERPRVGVTEDGELWLSDNTEELDALRAWVAQEDPHGSPPTIALSLWEVDELLEAAKVKHRDEMRLLSFMVHAVGSSKRNGGDGNADSDKPGGPAAIGGAHRFNPEIYNDKAADSAKQDPDETD